MQIVPKTITPDDPRYNEWNERGVNDLFKGRPDFIVPVDTIPQLKEALQSAINQNQYVVVRSGGHCLEDFVSGPKVQVVIDISKIKGVRFDKKFRCFEVMAGETVGEMLRELYNGWGVVLPFGEHPNIGIGGHIPGGAFGWLCRSLGLAVDYLYAVELLWVDENKNVKSIIASRELGDPNRELWWAHTGGGAGNFGIATRYWFRIPDTVSDIPEHILPKAPANVETFELEWQWRDIDATAFEKLVSNFGEWSYQHASPGIAACDLFCTLHLWNKAGGKIQLKGLMTDVLNADVLINDFMRFLFKGLDLTYSISRKKISWLDFVLNPFPDIFGEGRGSFKFKDAFLLRPFTIRQIKVIYKHLTSGNNAPGLFVGLATYGGKVNSIPPDATASFQRNAILTTSCISGWVDPSEKNKYLELVRAIYYDLYADTGGAPVPNELTGGCIIAHPDSDLLDPSMNKSGVPWYHFYYQGNYPRLQKVKAKWDPLNIFHHSLSVKP